MAEFERNTTGFTADVEKYGDGNVIKLYRDYVPQADIEREIICTECVQNRGLPVPEYRGYTEKNGKRGIILEYIEGDSMMKVLVSGEVAPEKLAMDFAQIHYNMHQCRAEGLENSKVRYERLLRMSEYQLGGDLTNRMLRLLKTLPDGDRLCHNDFHPGNMIYNSCGMFAIDWSDATIGDPFADVARTIQMFDFGLNVQPGKVTPEQEGRMKAANANIKVFIRAYEAQYAELCGMSVAELRERCGGWMALVPASRFNIEWDCNKGELLKMFYEYFATHELK